MKTIEKSGKKRPRMTVTRTLGQNSREFAAKIHEIRDSDNRRKCQTTRETMEKKRHEKRPEKPRNWGKQNGNKAYLTTGHKRVYDETIEVMELAPEQWSRVENK
ncbi:unnamed protein product [Hermetia illucens]|uniref:Uncharacterized protein n=1 Tax=Hermetia illucens TaxID=343691 RepID=A0A7R8URJ3_HERIL|nr:unnamed protein product [Hermetia illucens]